MLNGKPVELVQSRSHVALLDVNGSNRFHETPVLAFDISIASRPKRCVPDMAYTLLCQEVRESRGVERRTVVRPNRMRYPVTAEVSIHTLNNGVSNSSLDDVDFVNTAVVVNQHDLKRARKIFSLPVAEFFGPSPGAIFLVAFSFNLVAIVRQDSKV